jgi:hypothetical protein
MPIGGPFRAPIDRQWLQPEKAAILAAMDVDNTGSGGPRAIGARTQPCLNPPLILLNALAILLRTLPPQALLGPPGPFLKPSQNGDELSAFGLLFVIRCE